MNLTAEIIGIVFKLSSADGSRQVAEELLQRTGEALDSGDFELFCSAFAFPNIIETFDGRRVIETKETLRDVFERTREELEHASVTDVIRHCVEVKFLDEDTIYSTHETRLMQENVLIQDPFPVFSVIRRTPEGWKGVYSSYALPDVSSFNPIFSKLLHDVSKPKDD